MLEEGWRPDDWVGFLVGLKLYFKFFESTEEEEHKEEFKKLTNEIKIKLQIKEDLITEVTLVPLEGGKAAYFRIVVEFFHFLIFVFYILIVKLKFLKYQKFVYYLLVSVFVIVDP